MRFSISEAKAVLASLVRMAEDGKTVELSRYSDTKAVIISKERYDRLVRLSREV